MSPHSPIFVPTGTEERFQCSGVGAFGESLGGLLAGRIVDIFECV
jgi:hypothetical protein